MICGESEEMKHLLLPPALENSNERPVCFDILEQEVVLLSKKEALDQSL